MKARRLAINRGRTIICSNDIGRHRGLIIRSAEVASVVLTVTQVNALGPCIDFPDSLCW